MRLYFEQLFCRKRQNSCSKQRQKLRNNLQFTYFLSRSHFNVLDVIFKFKDYFFTSSLQQLQGDWDTLLCDGFSSCQCLASHQVLIIPGTLQQGNNILHGKNLLTSYNHLLCMGGREDDSGTPLSPPKCHCTTARCIQLHWLYFLNYKSPKKRLHQGLVTDNIRQTQLVPFLSIFLSIVSVALLEPLGAPRVSDVVALRLSNT